jgi:hypothetical protein
MRRHSGSGRAVWLVLALGVAMLYGAGDARAQQQSSPRPVAPVFTVDGRIALQSFMSLTDAHLRKTADVLALVAGTDAARSADWQRIRGPLAEAAAVNVPAVHWFALPDGTYWTLEQDRIAGNLADRPYFPRLLAGEIVMGDLVVSRSTGRSTAIVAVPVRAADGTVVGALGNSVHLDSLSMLIENEMDLQPDQIFFTLDTTPMVGLHNESGIIFLHPLEQGDPELEAAIREILRNEEGTVSYSFRGQPRTVLYRRSPMTGWWFAFGLLHR